MIQQRLQALREELKIRNIDATIISGNDPHFSEYPAKCWKYRKWISGFTGSAGTAVITLNEAALWVDSRYFIQAREELKGTEIEMQKSFSALPYIQWLKSRLGKNAKIGIDAKLFSINQFNTLKSELSPVVIEDIGDVFDKIYTDRPEMPETRIFFLPDEVTGKNRREKLTDFVRNSIPDGEIYLLSALDEIAWILNLRASDIAYNPVAISYLAIDYPDVHLFVSALLDENDRQNLEIDGIIIHPYEEFYSFVSNIQRNRKVKINFGKTNCRIYKILENNNITVVEEKTADKNIALAKSVKNEVELAGFRDCMITDGVAMVKFLKWLNDNVGKIKITEIEAARKLEEYRSAGKNYRGLSFRTISAYGANSALPHYSPDRNNKVEIGKDAFYLVDSGAQYLTGTTDLTRTLHFGEPDDDEKENYTLVLKGMLNLSMAIFPANTRGSQLDILARKALWERGKNFLHGTGHGVGHFLNVHEGPQSIRCEENPVTLLPGMITSNEPAIYIENKYGIRIENLLACKFEKNTGFGDFYSFETLTLCPIDTKAIDISLMNADEINRLNDYHSLVCESLSPHLDSETVKYLKKITSNL